MMKTRLLSMLALSLTMATGAWAQGTVDFKQGTVDAENWEIKSGETTVEPGVTEVNVGDPVTATYKGTKRVKSVTAVVTPWLEVNKLSEITDAITALNMQPGGEYTLTVTFDPTKISTEESDDNKLYMSIPDDATLNLVFKNTLPNGTHLTIGDAQFAGMSEPEVEAYFTGKDEPESKNHLNLDFAGGTGSEDVDGSGLYLTLITPTSTVSTGSSSGNVWFEEIIIYTGGDSFFSKLGSCIKKATVKVGKTVASVATKVGKTVAKAAKTVVKKVVNFVVTKIIKPAVEQLVEKIKKNIVKEPLIPTVITASPSNFTFFEGQTQQFDVKVTLGNDGIGGDITYSSSDPTVATVDGNGNVKAISGGKPGNPKYATITAIIGSGDKKATRECRVGVEQTPRASEISFPTPTASVPKDRAIILDPNIVIGNDAASNGNYRISFTTNSPSVVAVNDFGYVRGLTMGEAVVTAHYGPLSATCTVTVTESVDGMTHVLDNVVAGFIAESGDVLTGTLKGEYKIEIADGATITLDNATVKPQDGTFGDAKNYWPALTCLGDATIIIKDGTENNLEPFYYGYPGISVPGGKTLTIMGESAATGKLNIYNRQGSGIGGSQADNIDPDPSGNIVIKSGIIDIEAWDDACIGAAWFRSCGNITIEGGELTLETTRGCAIGAATNGDCGNITITGGTIKTIGERNNNTGRMTAGIGGCRGSIGNGTCGDILISGGTLDITLFTGYCGKLTITDGVTKVTANNAFDDIETSSSITIGGTVYWDGENYQNVGETYLKTSPLIYEPGK